jgi:hypothetical protein
MTTRLPGEGPVGRADLARTGCYRRGAVACPAMWNETGVRAAGNSNSSRVVIVNPARSIAAAV